MAAAPYQYLQAKVEQGVLVLTTTRAQIEGEEVAATLRQEMCAAADEYGINQIIVDFHQTTYISSAAFWPLLSLWSKIKDGGGRLILCGLSPMVGDVFYTTRMISPDVSIKAPFQVEANLASALARMREPAPQPDPSAESSGS
jgi:anti-anti-sigma factor